MAHAEKITFQEFRTRFSTEESCRAELFRLRFPNGFVCPKCGCTEYYPVRGRNTFQCRACRRQTSVTAGTVMHRTHLPLTAWFWAIYLCATDKRGISAVQLSRTLNICYESAWYLLHRIRCAMAQRDENYALSGIVEMDDGYAMLIMLDMAHICASSGSACTSGSLDPSHVLLAIGLPHEIAHGSLRLTLGYDNTQEEIDGVVDEIEKIVARLRSMSPLYEDFIKKTGGNK